jgi:hypothetical protein
LAIRVQESQRSLSERFVALARAGCAPDLSLVLDVGQAESMKFPDNSLFYRRFSTVCVARDGRPALFVTSKRGGDALLSMRCRSRLGSGSRSRST